MHHRHIFRNSGRLHYHIASLCHTGKWVEVVINLSFLFKGQLEGLHQIVQAFTAQIIIGYQG